MHFYSFISRQSNSIVFFCLCNKLNKSLINFCTILIANIRNKDLCLHTVIQKFSIYFIFNITNLFLYL